MSVTESSETEPKVSSEVETTESNTVATTERSRDTGASDAPVPAWVWVVLARWDSRWSW